MTKHHALRLNKKYAFDGGTNLQKKDFIIN